MKILFSAILTALAVVFVMIPMIIDGYCPIGSATLIAILAQIVMTYSYFGIKSKKSSAASIANIFCILEIAAIATFILLLNGGLKDYKTFCQIGILTDITIFATLGFVEFISIYIVEKVSKYIESNPETDFKELFNFGIKKSGKILLPLVNIVILLTSACLIPIRLYKLNFSNFIFTVPLVSIVTILTCILLTAITSAWMLKRK
ncbi:MAG: YibE/F family protein [Clostridiaceae bacterium]|jgi:hypothetical protein|nr:YibE/F family protein [Clostridiaceae bacterium]